MSKRTEKLRKKTMREINQFKKTGKPSEWLVRRALKNQSLFGRIFPALAPPPKFDAHTIEWKFFKTKIIDEMNKSSALYERFKQCGHSK